MAHQTTGRPAALDTAAGAAAGLIELARAALDALRTASTDPVALPDALDRVEDIAHRLSVEITDLAFDGGFDADELAAELKAGAPVLTTFALIDARIAP